MLDAEQLDAFGRDGQLTVPNLFSAEEIDRALADLEQWDKEFRATLTDEEREWYLKILVIHRVRFVNWMIRFFIGQRFGPWPWPRRWWRQWSN